MNTEKSGSTSRDTKLYRMVARIKEILQCIVCLEVVGCPAVQCEAGHLMCGQCRNNLEENTCPTCRQPLTTVRNLAVEQVVEVLPKECPYTDYGCQELLDADEVDTHRVTCPFRQFSCPHPPCSWTGYKPEIIGHLRDRHPQQVLSSNKQAVQVPVVWNEVSSWTIFFKDEILLLKFHLQQATSMLFGSFKCLGSLIPVDSFKYYITVKKGDLETNLSGGIEPERGDTSVQCDEDWDIVFSRNRFDVHTVGGSHSNDFILVDVEVKDNRREGAGQEDGEVVEQAQQCEVRDEGGAPTTAQDGSNNQLDKTADRVTQKLGDWIYSYDPFINPYFTVGMRTVYSIITETRSNFIKVIQKSIDDIASVCSTELAGTPYVSIRYYHSQFFRDFTKKQIKCERMKAAHGVDMGWMDDYFRICHQAVSEVYYENMLEYNTPPDIDERELEGLVTARERRLRDESAQRLLWRAHLDDGPDEVKDIIWHIGKNCNKSKEEVDSLTNDATKIFWSDITLPYSSTF